MGQKLLDFGDLDTFTRSRQHFEYQILTKTLVCTRSFQPNNGFWSNITYCVIRIIKKLIRFSWPWHNFPGHHTIKTVKMSPVYTLSPKPVGGFWPNSKETSIEHGEEMIRFCWPWPHFQGHTSTLNVKFWPKSLSATYLLNQKMDSGQTFRIVSLG